MNIRGGVERSNLREDYSGNKREVRPISELTMDEIHARTNRHTHTHTHTHIQVNSG